MYKLITSQKNNYEQSFSCTAKELEEILKSIDELKNCSISIVDNGDGTAQMIINDDSYSLSF